MASCGHLDHPEAIVSIAEQAERRVGELDLTRLHELAGDLHGAAHIGTLWFAPPIVGQAADAATTLYVLSRTPGTYEANPAMAPLVRKPGAFVAVKLAMGAGLAFASHLLARDGHTRAAKVLSVGAGALGVAAAVHNLGVK